MEHVTFGTNGKEWSMLILLVLLKHLHPIYSQKPWRTVTCVMELIFNSGCTNAVIIYTWICTLPLILSKESVFKVWYTCGLSQQVTLWFPAFAAANLNSKPNLHWYGIQSVWNMLIRNMAALFVEVVQISQWNEHKYGHFIRVCTKVIFFLIFLKVIICWIFFILFFYHCTMHFDIYKVHTPTNALFIKLDKVLKFTLKRTLTCSYMFWSMTIIREPSLEL